jgi:hypothetical protein
VAQPERPSAGPDAEHPATGARSAARAPAEPRAESADRMGGEAAVSVEALMRRLPRTWAARGRSGAERGVGD